MSTTRTAPKVKTTHGTLEGSWSDGVASFLGIPYARPPVGDLRWAPPVPAPPLEGVRPAQEAGPIPPQPPSRLQAVMGPMRAPEQAEDCLSLNVWTTAPGRRESRPVLVFLHGGGYVSGAGSAAWFNGSVLARRGDAVVVTINYRLGALGYLYLSPAITGAAPVANLGLQDQRLALEWVKENIAEFGGDPGNVAVVGQSGGAHSILGLSGMSAAPELFQRAILQSGPFGMPAKSPEAAQRVTAIFMEAAGVPGGGLEELRSLSVQQILGATREALMKTFVFGSLEPPFHLVVDGEVLKEEPVALGMEGSLDGVAVLVGFTRHEATAFYCTDDSLWELDAGALAERLARTRGEHAAEKLGGYAERSADDPAAMALCHMVGDEFFIAQSVELAERRARRGRPTYVYRFNWASDAFAGRLGACHTIELPFVFNNPPAWHDAPMLGGVFTGEVAQLGDRLQDAWLSFAATGDPGHMGLPRWDAFGPDTSSTMDLGTSCAAIDDPSDGRRSLWAQRSGAG